MTNGLQAIAVLAMATMLPACAHHDAPATQASSNEYDAQLAEELGADDYGRKSYIFVTLKTGPADITDATLRSEIFAGHFANMRNLAEQGKLVLAGPFIEAGDKRGLLILNTASIEEAKAWTANDPAVAAGIFVAEYDAYYGSAALQLLNDLQPSLQKTQVN